MQERYHVVSRVDFCGSLAFSLPTVAQSKRRRQLVEEEEAKRPFMNVGA